MGQAQLLRRRYGTGTHTSAIAQKYDFDLGRGFVTVYCMTRARKHLVSLSDTLYYHVTSRCVRRAFLCGADPHTGKNFEHRKPWVEDRVRVLSSLFSIHICAYAIMSNHYHLVVRVNPDEPPQWTDDEVLTRWTAMFRGPTLVQRHRAGETLRPAEMDTVRALAAVYRKRLGSLSWFMKCLNEPIARRANAEDGCTGHFWEARFHSQALCSDRALLASMAYVDLNPVRAGIAKVPERSKYTSIRARFENNHWQATHAKSVAKMFERGEIHHFDTRVRSLMPFFDDAVPISPEWSAVRLPMRREDYFRLVDAAGRILVRGKKGRIDPALEPILVRLELTGDQWVQASPAFRQNCRRGHLTLKKTA